jgi:hypothetical protein
MELSEIETAADMLQYLADHGTEFVLREQSDVVAYQNVELMLKTEQAQIRDAIISVIVSHLPHDQFCSLISEAIDILRMDKQLPEDISDA